MAEKAVEFHLSDEILAIIPTDPYDQLDLARKITSIAISSRISRLESETSRLRQTLSDKDRVVSDLEARLSRLARLLQDSEARLRSAVEENVMLSKERESLVAASKKLARDLAKLETFKRHLAESLSDDSSSVALQAEAMKLRASTQSSPRNSSWSEEGSLECSMGSNLIPSESKESIEDVGITVSSTPVNSRLSPTMTPKLSSLGGSSSGSPKAGLSPNVLSGTTSPVKSQLSGSNTLPSCYPSSHGSTAPSSPPQWRSLSGPAARIDGKEFFRQARSRLSLEQFREFLANIKELNAHRQSREEALEKAEKIFGADNRDLYISFHNLLFRNLS